MLVNIAIDSLAFRYFEFVHQQAYPIILIMLQDYMQRVVMIYCLVELSIFHTDLLIFY